MMPIDAVALHRMVPAARPLTAGDAKKITEAYEKADLADKQVIVSFVDGLVKAGRVVTRDVADSFHGIFERLPDVDLAGGNAMIAALANKDGKLSQGSFNVLALRLAVGGVTSDEAKIFAQAKALAPSRAADDVVHEARAGGVAPMTALKDAGFYPVHLVARVDVGVSGGLTREPEMLELARTTHGIVGIAVTDKEYVLSVVVKRSGLRAGDQTEADGEVPKPLWRRALGVGRSETAEARHDKAAIQAALQRVLDGAIGSLATEQPQLATTFGDAMKAAPKRTANDDMKYTPERWRLGKDTKHLESSGYMTERVWRSVERNPQWFGDYQSLQGICDLRALRFPIDALGPGDLQRLAGALTSAIDGATG